MTRFFAFLFLLSQSAVVSAAEWWFVTSAGSGAEEIIFFVDRDSMRAIGGTKTAWRFVIHETIRKDGVRKSKDYFSFNCSDRTSTLRSYINYGNNDRIVSSHTLSYYQQTSSPTAPDTVGESILEFVCNGPAEDDFNVTSLGMSPEQFAARYFRE
jgi:hypothetical protein